MPAVFPTRLYAWWAAFLLVLASPFGFAQQPAQSSVSLPDAPVNQAVRQDYSQAKPGISLIGVYPPRQVPKANLENSPRLESLLKQGVITLSLSDAIALALQDNLDIDIARYNLPIADTDILRSKGGGQPLGVNAGVVQGTPGGSGAGVSGGALTATGSGSGGTSAGAGGVGAGASGLVQSTLGAGPEPPQFDPVVTSTLELQRQATPATTFFSGAPIVSQNTGLADFTYSQGFATGTNLAFSFNNSRITTNSDFYVLSPQLSSSFLLTLTQHLLRGRSWGVNRRFIEIAKNTRTITDQAFRQQVMTTVVQIEDIYWDLVNATEDLRVQKETLALAERTLADNQKQVQAGTLAPIEITNAQSQVATARQNVIIAETNLQLQQLYMLNAISRNLQGSAVRSAVVVPTDTMTIPETEPVEPVEGLIQEALGQRPELAQARIDLKNRQISGKAAKEALQPTLDLVGFYGGNGLGGVANPNYICLNANASALCSGVQIPTPSGYGAALENAFNGSAPDRGVALQMQIPIRNRQAQSVQVRAELETRQAQMRLQQLENQVAIQVRNAQFALQQNRARVMAAQEGERYARELLDAEQKKFALGASTSYLVFQQRTRLATAEEDVLAAKIAYVKSRVNLDYALARTLDRNGVVFGEAKTGNVSHAVLTPGVAPAPQP